MINDIITANEYPSEQEIEKSGAFFYDSDNDCVYSEREMDEAKGPHIWHSQFFDDTFIEVYRDREKKWRAV
jgi:hypothetical protein